MLAAQEAGLNVLQILDEPTAAALAYGYSRHEDMQKTILIYDLGGGTFDCTVMKLDFVGDSRKMEVITTGGNHQLGGKDWDALLTDWLIEEFCERTGEDPSEMRNDPEMIQFFSENSEKTKQLLSSKASTPVMIRFNGQKEKIDVTQEKFEELTEGKLNETIMLVEAMMEAKGLSVAKDIDEIILVGGSTYMPQVEKRLEQEYGKPWFRYEPNKAVAMGAALMASFAYDTGAKTGAGDTQAAGGGAFPSLGGSTNFEAEDGKTYEVIVKCTKSYGLICLDENDQRMVGNIIYKDTEKPCVQSRTFGVSVDNQSSVLLEIFENDSLKENAKEDESTRMYEDSPLPLPPGARKGDPIEITFILDANGMLKVEMVVAGQKQTVEPVRIGNGTNEIGMDTNLRLGG